MKYSTEECIHIHIAKTAIAANSFLTDHDIFQVLQWKSIIYLHTKIRNQLFLPQLPEALQIDKKSIK